MTCSTVYSGALGPPTGAPLSCYYSMTSSTYTPWSAQVQCNTYAATPISRRSRLAWLTNKYVYDWLITNMGGACPRPYIGIYAPFLAYAPYHFRQVEQMNSTGYYSTRSTPFFYLPNSTMLVVDNPGSNYPTSCTVFNANYGPVGAVDDYGLVVHLNCFEFRDLFNIEHKCRCNCCTSTAICEFFWDSLCDYSNPCMNNATCVPHPTLPQYYYTCTCANDGWTGQNCSTCKLYN